MSQLAAVTTEGPRARARLRQAVLEELVGASLTSSPWREPDELAGPLGKALGGPPRLEALFEALSALERDELIEGRGPYYRAVAYLSLAEAAILLGVVYKTLWRDVHAGRLPALRVRGTLRVRPADLERVYAYEPIPAPSRAERAADLASAAPRGRRRGPRGTLARTRRKDTARSLR